MMFFPIMRTIVAVSICTLLMTLLAFTTVFESLGISLSSEEGSFEAGVDYAEGTNLYALVEIDEGDNNEETSITLIRHEFVFSVNNDEGAISWDFGDGTAASGSDVIHGFDLPGIYTVTATSITPDKVETSEVIVTVDLDATAEADNMECACAPTGKDTIIDLLAQDGTMSFEGFVKVEHDGSSESCSLRNPLQECHIRIILETTSSGNVIAQDVMFDDTFRSNELVFDFDLVEMEFEDGEGLQIRLETDQIRDWHKPTAEWSNTAPVSVI